MHDTQNFSSLVGRIYDRVTDPAAWSTVLGEITQEFDGVIATLAVLDIATRKSRFGAAFGAPHILEPLIDKYAAEMPFYDLVPKAETDIPITLAQLCAMHGPDGLNIFKSTRLWTEWFEPNHIADCLCTNIINAHNRVAAFVINVSTQRKPVEKNDIDRLSLLTPHIRRAISISDLFEGEERAQSMLRSVIDHVAISIFVVDQNMKLQYANSSGEDMLRAASMVKLSNNVLKFSSEYAHDAVRRAILLGERSEFSMGALGIGVPLANTEHTKLAHVLPLLRRTSKHEFGDGTAAIFVATNHGTQLPALDALAALFGLTAAEKRVTAAIAAGKMRAEIARQNGVTDGTVKAQLEAIFDKTGTSNQRTLQNLVRDLSPPVVIPKSER